MNRIPYADILMGVNDAQTFLHTAQKRRQDEVSLREFMAETDRKRHWSLINPGAMLAVAYMYFVFGYEHKMIEGADIKEFLHDIEVEYEQYDVMSTAEKGSFVLRRLRNAIAHCRYNVVVRSANGALTLDGDIYFVFEDQRPNGEDRVRMTMSLPTFGNLIETAGELSWLRAQG